MKQPWLAVFLSALLPGVGQIYGEKRLKGIIFILVHALLLLIGPTGIVGFILLVDASISRLFILTTIISVILIFIFVIYVLFNAYRVAKEYNANYSLNVGVNIKRQPWLAVFLSYLLPGIGQIYNEQTLKGVAFIIITIIFWTLERVFYPSFFLFIFICLFAMKDAFDSAEKINGSNRKFSEQGRVFIKIFVVIVLLIHSIPFGGIIRAHLLQAFKIPAGSMLPTLEIGDHILVDKTNKAKASIKRGNIIVFIYPEDEKKDFIKRVIGLPGERIEIKDKVVYINDEKLTENYIIHQDPHIKPKECEPRDNMGPITVPSDSLFVLGDNRDQSYDSRYWGLVKTNKVKGKAIKIYWSWDSKNKIVRWERIGMRIK